MKESNRINTDEKWKETLEGWSPDVEGDDWNNFASRVPSGPAFRLRQCVEGTLAKIWWSFSRPSSRWLAIGAFPVIGLLVYWAFVENNNPLSNRSAAYCLSSASFSDTTAPSFGCYAMPQPTDGVGGLCDAATGSAFEGISSFTSADALGNACGGASAASSAGSMSLSASTSGGGALMPTISNGFLCSTGRAAVASRPSAPALLAAGGTAPSRAATDDAAATLGSGAAASRAHSVGGARARSGAGDAASSNANDRGSFAGRWAAKRQKKASSSRGKWLKERSIDDATKGSFRPDSRTIPSASSNGGGFKSRDIGQPSIGRGFSWDRSLRVLPNAGRGFALSPAWPSSPSSFWRNRSFFKGASLELGAACSDSASFGIVGAKAFVGVLYGGRVGLSFSLGARCLGSFVEKLDIVTVKRLNAEGVLYDSVVSKSTSHLLRPYYQATWGANVMVRLYAGSSSSIFALAGANGCYSFNKHGNSSLKSFSILSSVRASACYRWNVEWGGLFVAPFVDYNVGAAGILPRSSMAFGVNVGVTF